MAQCHDEKWEYNFAMLQAYYAEYGSFPIDGVVYQGVNLGKWCANQKLLVKRGKCPANRMERLQQYGLLATTRDAKWEQCYGVMQRFVAEHGRFPKREELYEGVQLGIWYAEQKRRRNQVRYSAERLAKLAALGLIEE